MRVLKLLTVDDNEADIYYLKTVLDRMGVPYSMVELEDGESAVKYLMKRGEYRNAPDPDLIFLDLNLPKLSGVQVLEAVSSRGALPFCILTVSPQQRDQLKKRFGIRRIAYVVKPVTREMIMNCFRCYDHLMPLAEQVAVMAPDQTPVSLGR